MSSHAQTKAEDCLGWPARDSSGVLSPYKFSRWPLGSDDVSIKITHRGVCYADVIGTRNKHGDTIYPVVPRHEITGVVKEVGRNVHRFKVGDPVGVGTLLTHAEIVSIAMKALKFIVQKGRFPLLIALMRMEQSQKADILTISLSKKGLPKCTQGEILILALAFNKYCFKIPSNYPLASAAPLLCAGITVYAPMVHHKLNQTGKSLGVIGLGDLGHMAVKFRKAFGLNVTVFSMSISKKVEALNLLGADNFVLSSDQEQMKGLSKSLDFIVDTASGDHLFDPYMLLLKIACIYVLIGFPSEVKFSPTSLNWVMRTISGSITGGVKVTQEMIDFCAAHKIYPQIEVIPIQYANEALERLMKRDVKYRFVIDIENTLK